MSVNIFGSSKQVSGGPGRKGLPGVGFKLLDNEGNFDIDSKRLANVAQPVSDNDAVTKVYVNEAISKHESNIDFIESRLKQNLTHMKSRIFSLFKDIPGDLDEAKSEIDHLKSFCERMANNIADIKEEYVTQQNFMNSMVANSKMLTELEKKVDLSSDIIDGLGNDMILKNSEEIENLKKVVQSYKDENIRFSERINNLLADV